jgi:hypothetical protein
VRRGNRGLRTTVPGTRLELRTKEDLISEFLASDRARHCCATRMQLTVRRWLRTRCRSFDLTAAPLPLPVDYESPETGHSTIP